MDSIGQIRATCLKVSRLPSLLIDYNICCAQQVEVTVEALLIVVLPGNELILVDTRKCDR
jgi:hypothetical protein